MQWEYKIVSVDRVENDHTAQDLLDAYSRIGWELGFVISNEHALRFIFKKPRVTPAADAVSPTGTSAVTPASIKPLTQRLIDVSPWAVVSRAAGPEDRPPTLSCTP